MSTNRARIIALALGSVFLLIILVFAIASDDADLEDGSWQMTSLVVDDSMTPAIAGTAVTITFDGGEVQGFAGCNNYFGGYTSDDESLSIGDLASTMALCEDAGISDQEFLYFAHLSAVDGYRIEGEQLTLSDGAADLVVFEQLDG